MYVAGYVFMHVSVRHPYPQHMLLPTLLHAVYHMVNHRTAFHARLCGLLRDGHMPCALGLYADMYIELWDKSSYVLV